MNQEQRDNSRDAFLEYEARKILDPLVERGYKFIEIPNNISGKLDLYKETDKTGKNIFEIKSPEAEFALVDLMKLSNVGSREIIKKLE